MTAAPPFPRVSVAAFGVALLTVLLVATTLPGSGMFRESPGAGALGITLDLVLLVPLLFYLLVVRPTGIAAFWVAPVALLGFLAASWILPEAHHGPLEAAELLLVPAELGLLSLAIRRAYRAARALPAGGSHAAERLDPLERFRRVLGGVFPAEWMARVAAHEVAFLYYALLAWRAEADVREGERAYSYHRRNGYGGMLVAVTLVALVELLVVHLLVARWSAAAAWGLTAVSAYGMVWMMGHFQAVRLRPIVLAPDGLLVRIGLLWSVRVPYGGIVRIREARGSAAPARSGPGYLRAVTLGDPRLLLELASPVEVEGPYGYRKRGVTRIGIAVDDGSAFREELARRVGVEARGE